MTEANAVPVTVENVRDVIAAAWEKTQGPWPSLPWKVVPTIGKPIIASDRGGNIFHGYISTWQEANLVVAVVNALPTILDALAAAPAGKLNRDFTARRIKELMDEGDGFWTACSGCQESVDGYVSERDYPFDPMFRCQPGGGCSVCGGIGVLWDAARGYANITGVEEPAAVPVGGDEESARTYFERGFMACYAWQYTNAGAQLSDAVLDRAWDHREEGGELPAFDRPRAAVWERDDIAAAIEEMTRADWDAWVAEASGSRMHSASVAAIYRKADAILALQSLTGTVEPKPQPVAQAWGDIECSGCTLPRRDCECN
ncbi:hypothetical protein [Sphingomonas hankookensis]